MKMDFINREALMRVLELQVTKFMLESTTQYLADWHTTKQLIQSSGDFTEEEVEKIMERALDKIRSKFDEELLPKIIKINEENIIKVDDMMNSLFDDHRRD